MTIQTVAKELFATVPKFVDAENTQEIIGRSAVTIALFWLQ